MTWNKNFDMSSMIAFMGTEIIARIFIICKLVFWQGAIVELRIRSEQKTYQNENDFDCVWPKLIDYELVENKWVKIKLVH